MALGDFILRLKEMSGISSRKVATVQDRKAVRIRHQFSMRGLRPNGDTVSLRTIDCAATGVRVVCPQSLPKHELISLAVFGAKLRPGDVETEAPRARVVWSRKKRGEPSYVVGLAFVLDTAEQRRRLAQFLLTDCKVALADPREKRRNARASTNARAHLKPLGGEGIPATVRNVSVGGMNILSETRLQTGLRLDVTLFFDDVPRPIVCSGEVRRIRQAVPGTYEVGLSFGSLDGDDRDALVRHLTRILPQA